MYLYSELIITMNTETAATAAVIAAKEALANTSIKEYFKGEIGRFADELEADENNVLGCRAIYDGTLEQVLPEILKAIAVLGNEFHGKCCWESDYDEACWEFSFDGKELSITYTFYDQDDRPVCQECEEEDSFCYSAEEDCYVCTECGHSISIEEFEAAWETTTIQKFTF